MFEKEEDHSSRWTDGKHGPGGWGPGVRDPECEFTVV